MTYQDPPRLVAGDDELARALRDLEVDHLAAGPSAAARAALWQGLSARSGAPWALGLRARIGLLSSALLIAVGLAVWPRSAPTAPHGGVPVVPAPTGAPVAHDADPPLPPPAISAVPAPPPERAPPKPPKRAVQPSSPEAELGLLVPARKLVAVEPARALALVERHRARFAHGVFAEEREVLAVEALVRLGRGQEARARAARFARAHPASAQRARLDALLGNEGSPGPS